MHERGEREICRRRSTKDCYMIVGFLGLCVDVFHVFFLFFFPVLALGYQSIPSLSQDSSYCMAMQSSLSVVGMGDIRNNW